MSTPSRFLARWSRLKRQAGESVAAAPIAAPAAVAGHDPVPGGGAAPLPEGVDLAALLRDEASEAVRRQALRKIFADPHFNVMDGLDVYIDDYSISEPIPDAMMATLRQARMLFDEAESEKPDTEANQEAGQEAGHEAGHEAGGAPSAVAGSSAVLAQNEAGCDKLDQPGQNEPSRLTTELCKKDN